MGAGRRLSRRKLLWLGAGGAALGAAGAFAGGVASIQPRRHRIVDPHPDRPEHFETPTRVVVVGGGLAGMSAALELAERGAQVTIVETADHLGGKLGGWPIRVAGQPYAMEHGFHGFFDQYYNLSDVLTRIGVDDNLVRASEYPMLFSDGSAATFEPGGMAPFPFNLAGFYLDAEMLKLSSVLEAGPRMESLLKFDPVQTYAEFDGIDFESYCAEAGMDQSLVEYFFRPFAKTTLNDPGNVSAAYAIRFMHFFYIGNPDGLGYRYTRDDCMTSVVTPWREHLEGLGVEVLTGTACSRLLVEGDRVTGVELGTTSMTQTRLANLDPDTVSSEQAEKIGEDPDGAPLFARRVGAELVVLRGACTHMGCPVSATKEGFSCPCHGGRFDAMGQPVGGPPKRPLQRLPVVGQEVLSPASQGRTLKADAVVIASNTIGTRKIIARSDVPEGLARSVASLQEADPFAVTRMWLKGEVPRDGTGFYTVGGHERLDSIAVYERLQTESKRWAESKPGSIIELHSYGVPPAEDRGVIGNSQWMLEEFHERMPEWASAELVHSEVMQQRTFSGYAPGSHESRPGTKTELANLVFAGDWVRTDLPVALMEGAVTTGRLAANALLDRHGVRQATVESVSLRGPLA